MKLIDKHTSSKHEMASGAFIGLGSPLGNPKIVGVDGTKEEIIRWYRTWLANKIIDRDPAVENAMRNLSNCSLNRRLYDPKEYHGEVVVEYWHDLNEGDGDYEHRLRAFKAKHNLDRIIYSPQDDGITHINIYSKGNTELGKLASNFANTPFLHPTDGHFSSIEAYWYWLSLGQNRNDLRSFHGYQAKQAGKAVREELERNGTIAHIENFEARIKKAILCKIEQNERLRELLRASTLPLTHYYVWGTLPDVKVTSPSQYAWIHEYISDVRDYLNGKAHKIVLAGSRTITSYDEVKSAYEHSGLKAIEIVSGKAPGVDRLGERLAAELKLPVAEFPADWEAYPGVAGFMRNSEMVEYGTAAIAVWNGVSTGTMDTVKKFQKAGKPVVIFEPKK